MLYTVVSIYLNYYEISIVNGATVYESIIEQQHLKTFAEKFLYSIVTIRNAKLTARNYAVCSTIILQ